MIGEIAETNLPASTESTINDWFTINPISGGKEIKAKSPKTIGMNPNRAMPSYQEISIGDLQFTINSKTNEVLDSEGRPYNGKFANHTRAKAHAIKINSSIKLMCQDLMHCRMSAIISVKITTTDVTAIIRLLRE
mgnify:CR=1 FL=1